MVDWETIVSRDGPAVWRTIYRLLGNRADADECFQETFVAAIQFVRRKQVTHWRALLQRLATTRAVDRLRQRYRRSTLEGSADWSNVVGFESEPDDQAEAEELSAKLRMALTRLPPRQAVAFCLHHLEGWSHREIGEQISISPGAAGVLIHRARLKLQELLSSAPQGQG